MEWLLKNKLDKSKTKGEADYNTKGRDGVKTKWKKLLALMLMGACIVGCGSNQVRSERQSMKLEELGEISVCIREEGSGTRQTFEETIGDSQNISSSCHEADGNDEVVAYISENKNAIGYISGETLPEANGCHVVGTDEKITRPLNLVHNGVISDVEKDFLRYVQSAIKGKGDSFLSDQSKGNIKIGGSSSMADRIQEYADAYMKMNTNSAIAVVTTDSGQGINGTLDGTYDIGMVSRKLTDYENELLETEKVAEDEIVMIVNQENPIKYLMKEELVDIYSGKITDWESLKGGK